MSEEILCEAPGPGGATCVRPYGHDPKEGHAYSMTLELPPDIMHMLQSMTADLEHRIKAANSARRWYFIGLGIMLLSALIQILI